ncbi:hypothetical protein GF420_10445 [candidate division GN15 bacterium]|nr:hypothetical protein [candidate division GN15 bacterium]
MTDSFFDNDPQKKPTGDIPDLNGREQSDDNGASENVENDLRTDEGRLAAIMSYIPLLCFVPLLSMKENKEARFHARQGLVLFIIELVAVLFLLPGVSSLIFRVVLIAAAGLSIAGIYFALQGKNYKLPIIGDLAEKSKL